MQPNSNADLEQQLQACRAEIAELALALQAEQTARQQAEEALREMEYKFRVVFDQTFQFTGLLTTEGIVLDANQTALDFGGFQLTDVINCPFWETGWWTISPETQEQLKTAISQTAAGQFVRYEVDVLGKGVSEAGAKQPHVITIDFSLKPVKDERGNVVLLVAEGRDITQLKQAVQQEIEEQMTEILESMTDGFYALDRDWRFTYVNPQAEPLLQRTREQLIGHTIWEVYPEAIGTAFYYDYHKAMSQNTSYHSEEFCSCLDSWFEVHAYPAKTGLSVYLQPISDRKLAQQALYQREQEFRALAENAPDIIARFDKQLRHSYINTAAETVFGLSPQAIIGKTCQDLGLQEALCTYWDENLQQVFTTGCEHSIEFDLLTPDGKTKSYQTRIAPEFAKDGSVESIVTIARNVTQFKQAEATLRESQQLLQAILDAAPIGIYLKDLQGRFILMNCCCEALLGLSQEQIIGKTDYDFLPQQIADVFQASDRAVLEAGAPLEWEQVFPQPDEIRTFITTKFPLYDAAGTPYAIGGISTEITERKQMEIALRESEERFRQLAENIDIIFWMRTVDEQLNKQEFLYISPAFEKIWHRTRESLFQQPESWLDAVHPEDLPRLMALIERQRQGEYPERMYRIVLPDGAIRWIHDRTFPIYNPEGRIYRVAGIGEDITERKQVEEQIKASLREKEALLKEVHHRVKNNLQVISSLLDLQAQQIQDAIALQAFRESQKRVKSIAIIHEKLYQSEDLANVSLAEYIHTLTTYLLQTYSINPNNITLQLNVEPIFLELDTVIPCGLIITELVSNALKHGFPINTKGKIWIELNSVTVESTKKHTKKIILVIGNNGIKLEKPQNLFNAKSLGFQLVKILVSQLEGQIEINQERGTEFNITFSILNQ